MVKVHTAGARRVLSLLLAFVLIFSVCGLPVLADEADGAASALPPVPAASESFYVYDGADVLSAETEQAIVAKNGEIKEKYGVQIVVMTLDSMPGETPEERVAYAQSVLQTWKVGGDSGNGALLVLSISDADYWAVSGEGAKACFTNSVLGNLLKDQLEADFDAELYDDGVTKFVDAAVKKLESYTNAQNLAAGTSSAEPGDGKAEDVPEKDAADKKDEEKKGGNLFLSILKGIAVFLVIVLALFIILYIVIYVHGQMMRKKRREARRRKAQARMNAQSGDAAPQTRADRDYQDFMDRYK